VLTEEVFVVGVLWLGVDGVLRDLEVVAVRVGDLVADDDVLVRLTLVRAVLGVEWLPIPTLFASATLAVRTAREIASAMPAGLVRVNIAVTC